VTGNHSAREANVKGFLSAGIRSRDDRHIQHALFRRLRIWMIGVANILRGEDNSDEVGSGLIADEFEVLCRKNKSAVLIGEYGTHPTTELLHDLRGGSVTAENVDGLTTVIGCYDKIRDGGTRFVYQHVADNLLHVRGSRKELP
jgi:hypothetical protein